MGGGWGGRDYRQLRASSVCNQMSAVDTALYVTGHKGYYQFSMYILTENSCIIGVITVLVLWHDTSMTRKPRHGLTEYELNVT